jgi:hypothetical protein
VVEKSSEVVISLACPETKILNEVEEAIVKLRSDALTYGGSLSRRSGRQSMQRKLRGICSTLAVLAAVGASLCAANSEADGSRTATPVLVELFTSEGCSSCPPADALLERMDASQPIPGAQLIVLSEHVDYWNHDGWTDPFSSESMTDRQNGYVRMLGLKTAYTPQFLVDGTAEMQANDSQKVLALLTKAGSTPKVSMRLTSVTLAAGNPIVVQGHVQTDANPQKHKAEVFVAVALDHAESQVKRGENSGRHLSHVAVVAEIEKIGKLEAGKPFDQDFRVKLKLPATDSKSVRIIAFAQEPGPGKVLGATLMKAAPN